MNRTILVGNLTKDVEVKQRANLAIAEFSIAVNDRVKRGDEYVKETSYFECTAFGHTANALQKHTSKGSQILIEGRLKQETWKCKDSGQNRSKVKVIAEKVIFIGARQDKQESATSDFGF